MSFIANNGIICESGPLLLRNTPCSRDFGMGALPSAAGGRVSAPSQTQPPAAAAPAPAAGPWTHLELAEQRHARALAVCCTLCGTYVGTHPGRNSPPPPPPALPASAHHSHELTAFWLPGRSLPSVSTRPRPYTTSPVALTSYIPP